MNSQVYVIWWKTGLTVNQ